MVPTGPLREHGQKGGVGLGGLRAMRFGADRFGQIAGPNPFGRAEEAAPIGDKRSGVMCFGAHGSGAYTVVLGTLDEKR